MASAAETPTSRFDALSDEALGNIVCHLSRKPRSKPWEAFVPAQTLSSLLQLTSSLARVTRESFHRLTLAEPYKVARTQRNICHDIDRWFGYSRLLPHIDSMLGDSLLHLGDDFTSDIFLKSVAMKCHRLRLLSISISSWACPHFAAIFKTCGSSLEVLEIKAHHCASKLTRKDVAVLARNCPVVRQLKLTSVQSKTGPGPIWKGMGVNLQVLEIHSTDPHLPFSTLPCWATIAKPFGDSI